MSARLMKGIWWVDFRYDKQRIRRRSPVNTKRGAEEYERQLRQQLLVTPAPTKEVLTFDQWFNGRFWREWVIGRKNKAAEVEAKESIYRVHLKLAFGDRRLDDIKAGDIADFRAHLVELELSDKRINNIMAVLSKSLRYAVDVDLIPHAPKVGFFKVERPEIVGWELEEYARILTAARMLHPDWYAAVALAGEAGLRIGEIRELRWRDDVDLIGHTVTVNRQIRHGIVGTPKGRTRRVVPMTSTLIEALCALKERPKALVIRSLEQVDHKHRDYQAHQALCKVYDQAGLPRRGWHILRHTFGTHAALFGANPWRLMTWMGHKRVEETMLYVHVADAHRRALPDPVLAAAARHQDPDGKIIAMLAARGHQVGINPLAKTAAASENVSDPNGI